MRGKRVQVAIDAAVRTSPAHEHVPNRKDSLAEVHRVHALLAKLFFDRLARQVVHCFHVVIACRDEQRALAVPRRFGPRTHERNTRLVVRHMLADGAPLTQHVEARETTPARKSRPTSRSHSSRARRVSRISNASCSSASPRSTAPRPTLSCCATSPNSGTRAPLSDPKTGLFIGRRDVALQTRLPGARDARRNRQVVLAPKMRIGGLLLRVEPRIGRSQRHLPMALHERRRRFEHRPLFADDPLERIRIAIERIRIAIERQRRADGSHPSRAARANHATALVERRAHLALDVGRAPDRPCLGQPLEHEFRLRAQQLDPLGNPDLAPLELARVARRNRAGRLVPAEPLPGPRPTETRPRPSTNDRTWPLGWPRPSRLAHRAPGALLPTFRSSLRSGPHSGRKRRVPARRASYGQRAPQLAAVGGRNGRAALRHMRKTTHPGAVADVQPGLLCGMVTVVPQRLRAERRVSRKRERSR